MNASLYVDLIGFIAFASIVVLIAVDAYRDKKRMTPRLDDVSEDKIEQDNIVSPMEEYHDLLDALKVAEDEQNYERAAVIRDRINEIKNKEYETKG